MRRSLLLLSLGLLSLSLSAHASSITAGIYNLDAAYVDGHAVTGTLTLDSAGKVTLANLTFNDASFSNPGLPQFTLIPIANVYNGLSQNYITSSNNAGQIALYFNTTADANGHLALCIGNAQCGTSPWTVAPSALQLYGFYNSVTGSNPGLGTTNFSGGYLAEAEGPASAVTPEPASLMLVGTGIIGLVAFAGLRRSKPRGGVASEPAAQ